MPLITCPDCGKQSSDQAAACPNCGRPLRPIGIGQEGFGHRFTRVGCWVLTIGACLLAALIMLFLLMGKQ